MKHKERCCFCGHGDIHDINLNAKIKNIVEYLINNYNIKEFWVGNYGKFDIATSFAIKDLQKKYTDISLNLVVPYLKNDLNSNKSLYSEKYNEILVADIPQNIPKKFHIIKTNEYMINNSDILVCYIERNWGGAIRTYRYAKRKGIKIYNIAENPLKEIN